jgi:hypothetical protein
MIPAELTTLCHDYAAECWRFARRQDNAGDKLALIDMAQAWVILADCVNESLLTPHEALDSRRPANEC